MKFTKMHGLGNDYVYVNCFEERIADPPSLSKAISDRHMGVGSDGLIMVCPTSRADVRMEMYNADGSRAQMCGNGIRCVAKFAYERGLIQRTDDDVPGVPGVSQADVTNIVERTAQVVRGAHQDGEVIPISVDTDAGIKPLGLCVVAGKVDAVCVDMGQPSMRPADLPCTLAAERIADTEVSIGDRVYEMTCVSVGNPHAVVFVDDLDAVDLAAEGSAIENADIFPERINAHFVRVDGNGEITMVTWERGSGITLACGTGATAVCVAGAASGRTGRQIVAHLPGGDLRLDWAQDNHIYMTGPATEVFNSDWSG